MFGLLRGWRRRRVLARDRLDPALWREVLALPIFAGLSGDEQRRLAELSLLFLNEKALEPVGELELNPRMRLLIAALGSLPILALDLDYYRAWYAVVVYPSGFRARHEYVDEAGAVHDATQELVGEAWEQGPPGG